MSRWPHRPETLVARFERACFAIALAGPLPIEEEERLWREHAASRRLLLARVSPATAYQARTHG